MFFLIIKKLVNRIISPIFLLSNKCAIHFCREATKQNKQVWKPKTWISYSYLTRQRFQGYRILHATKYIWGGKSLLHLFNVIIYFFCFYFKTLKRYLIFKYLFLIKGTVKEKWKGEIDIKLCQNYTNNQLSSLGIVM